jgi:c(7)-type cytochrome triheme protein
MRIAVVLLLAFCAAVWAQTGRKRRPLPYEYGRVVINNYSERGAMAPVVFDHWRHRAKFTCRFCHVDVGFVLKAGATGIRAADNVGGYYCGACHNGKVLFDGSGNSLNEGKPVFAACAKNFTVQDRGRCERCHSLGVSNKSDADFLRFAKSLPKERFGNGLDWQRAEELGLINPVDFVEGISMRRKPLAGPKEAEYALIPKVESMPSIIFSHRKHTFWNGCELCHPEIFVSVKRGETDYSMRAIFQGKSCGVCHNNVAFPLTDCQRCHSKPV